MFRLLFDEHISPDVAKGIHRRGKDLAVHGFAEWDGGQFLGVTDEVILEDAAT